MWGLANSFGDIVIPYQDDYGYAHDFSEGFASVIIDENQVVQH